MEEGSNYNRYVCINVCLGKYIKASVKGNVRLYTSTTDLSTFPRLMLNQNENKIEI